MRADGLDLVFLPLGPEEIFFRQLVHQEFDASEMSLGSLMVYVYLPVAAPARLLKATPPTVGCFHPKPFGPV